jgi:hypothetical protein
VDKEELCELAQQLGFEVVFSKNLNWTYSQTMFYPIKKIIIGTRNFDENYVNRCGRGEVNEKIQCLILAHELGHIIVKNTIYENTPLEEYCLNYDSEFKIKQEIYAWKTVLNDTELTEYDLEFIQEQINEYILIEYVGTVCFIPCAELSQKLINHYKKVSK